MSWKTDKKAVIENRGFTTTVTMRLMTDTGKYRVRSQEQKAGEQAAVKVDEILHEDFGLPRFEDLVVDSVKATSPFEKAVQVAS